MITTTSPLYTATRNTPGVPRYTSPANKPNASIKPPESRLPQGVNYCADYSGCGLWRMKWPEYMLNCMQKCSINSNTTMVIDSRYYAGVSAVRVQRQATPAQKQFVSFLKQISQDTGMRVLYDVDDVVFREDIPMYNAYRDAFTTDEIRQTSQEIMELCDEITVPSEYMKQYYLGKIKNKNITVIPNLPPRFWLDKFFSKHKLIENYKRYCRGKKAKPRILYCGSNTHFDIANKNDGLDDFTHVNDSIIKTVKDFQWIFQGCIPKQLAPYVKAGMIEFYPWQPIMKLPQFIADLNVNVAVAPLADNNFNRSKSDIKFIEGAAHGIPVICQNLPTERC